MKKLSVEQYKGTRDFYPEDMFILKYIFTVMSKVVESYGYLEYTASLLEETSLYHAKSGDELVNEQTYSFVDRGGRKVSIRPEMTPTVARMIAKKRKSLAFPIRWYSIPNVFRYERPQRGRLREHWQLNVDLFGATGVYADADAELISIASDIMHAFGAKDKNFVFKINNRKLLNLVLTQVLGLDSEKSHQLSKLIDKKNKIKKNIFLQELKNIVIGKENAVLDLLDVTDIKSLIKILPSLADTDGVEELKSLFLLLKNRGIKNIVFDFSLIRGLDYYTGIIFEVFDTGGANNRSLFGGGRYDNLVDIFGVEKVPAIGFGMGDVSVHDYLQTYNLLPVYKTDIHLYVCSLNAEFIFFANKLALFLRKKGLNVEVDISERKVGFQIKTADKQKIPFVLCVGENEIKSGEFLLKDLRSGKQNKLLKSKLATFIKKNL